MHSKMNVFLMPYSGSTFIYTTNHMNWRQKRHLLGHNLFNLLTNKPEKFAYEEKTHKRQQKRGRDREHKIRKGFIKFFN